MLVPRRPVLKRAATGRSIAFCLLAGLAGIVPMFHEARSEGPEAGGPDRQAEEHIAVLQERTRRLGLARDVYWHVLLHYHPASLGRTVSDVDNAAFFLSPSGKTDPQSELDATLRAFFQPLGSSSIESIEGHPRCAFPARFHWLKERLQWEDSWFPVVPCRNFEVYRAEFRAESVSFIFASYYLGAPASVFGHTFMKFNASGEKKTDLLDYSVNYAANPGDLDPFRYSFYGLIGGYDGAFSLLPYHTKVREYSDMENRDIWEYVLNLNDAQILRMQLHLWELLGRASFNYFFATENCGYQLLGLIEAAVPEHRLTRAYLGWVIPSETVKLLAEHGLIRTVRYRPSARSIMRQRMQELTSGERSYVLAMLENRIEPYLAPTERNLYIYDTLLTALQYRKEGKKLTDDDLQFYRRLLRDRARLPAYEDRSKYTPQSTSVADGHAPVMLRMGAGADRDGPAALIEYRPIYHDLLAGDTGYPPFSELEEFAFRVRIPSGMPARLDSFRLLRLVSLSPYDGMSASGSMIVEAGAQSVLHRRADYSPSSLASVAFRDPLVALAGNQVRTDVERDLRGPLTPGDRFAFGLTESTEYRTVAYARGLYGFAVGNVYDRSSASYALGLLGGAYGETGAGSGRASPQATVLFVMGGAARRLKVQTNCYAFSNARYCEIQAGAGITLAKNHEIRLEGVDGREERNLFLSYVHFL